jgi:hypothetical protein
MSKFGESICLMCGRRFLKKHPNHKYCHWQCSSAAGKARRMTDLETAIAVSEERKANVDISGFRKKELPSYESEKGQDVSDVVRRIPRGRYVYAWFNDQSLLPFYIGKGVDDRAWKRHVRSDSVTSQFCQQIRASSSGFRVEIIRDNLTNEGAMLIESTLIAFASACGALLANQVDPLCRQERPPLELQQQTTPGDTVSAGG